MDSEGMAIGMKKFIFFAVAFVFSIYLSCAVAKESDEQISFKFDFGSGKIEPGYIRVLPATVYTKELGYGFEPGADVSAVDRVGDDTLRGDFCTSDNPFYFSVALPEGNYKVTVTLGDLEGESVTTIKAELRRLMIEKVRTAAGKFETRTFIVNIRTPRIPAGGEVRLKGREKTFEAWAWDDKLTLEFNNARPCVCALEFTRVDDIPTVYILGDSTVCDQALEPWNSWGQMLPRFFKPGVAIANHAESGESLRSSLGAGRLDKVMSLMKPGDYLFMQFGHNDMKSRSSNALATYKEDLKYFVTEARKRGGIPVLVTSMHRKSLDDDGKVKNTLGDYPRTVRQVAKEENVTLIDLHNMSASLYEAWGPENIDKAFVDGTHHNSYGSYQLAKCVVEGIRQSKLDLAKYIVDDFTGFDPNYPDDIDSFNIPASPMSDPKKPEGS
jgi:lysophospholipase L1-like esterase